MPRTSLSRRGEGPYADQSVESILETLLQSPSPNKRTISSVQPGGALSEKKKLPSNKLKTPGNAARTPYCPRERPDGHASMNGNGTLTRKIALAAVSPITLASKTGKPNASKTSANNLKLSSATNNGYSDASEDCFQVFAQSEEKLTAELGLQEAEKENPHRTYWPKYSDGGCFVVAVDHASLSRTKLLPDKSVHIASKLPYSSIRPKVGSKALPLPIAIACPQGVHSKIATGARKYGQGASRDSTPPNWSSSVSTTSDESGQEVSYLF